MNVVISRALTTQLLSLLDANREEMSSPQRFVRLRELLRVGCITYRLELSPESFASPSQNFPSELLPPTFASPDHGIGSALSERCRQYGQPYYNQITVSVGNPATTPMSHPPLVQRLADYGNLLQFRQRLRLGRVSSTPMGGKTVVLPGSPEPRRLRLLESYQSDLRVVQQATQVEIH